jgi:hypothetical protein
MLLEVMKRVTLLLKIGLLFAVCGGEASGQWSALFNGRDLEGWQPVGDGVWRVMRDGTLLGQRKPGAMQYQAWLYTTREFGEFDLELEYWTPLGGNSGVSLRDTSRARYAWGADFDRNRTPSHIGYEIQIINDPKAEYPSGSIYLFKAANSGPQRDTDWNSMRIQSRDNLIRVLLNGLLAAEHPGDPDRSKTGPIGLQLHGRSGPVMFRNVRIREVRGE